MDKNTLIQILENNTPAADPERGKALERLKSALALPRSVEDITEELPPEIRYLGPGAWLAAMGNSREPEAPGLPEIP